MAAGAYAPGASARVVGSSPHLDIAALAKVATQSLVPSGETDTLSGSKLFAWSPKDGRLSVNFPAFLQRFLSNVEAQRTLWPRSGDGFLRDVKRPGTGKSARIGVRDTDREATALSG